MATILISGMAGTSILAWGYGAADLIASTAIRMFKIVDRGAMRLYDKLYKVVDRPHTIG